MAIVGRYDTLVDIGTRPSVATITEIASAIIRTDGVGAICIHIALVAARTFVNIDTHGAVAGITGVADAIVGSNCVAASRINVA